ncbi:sensor histidine kinase [Streptomyces sp. YU58]|uniref:sensor histidine kinase n=1 Tax=Streptomyces sp. SX92 TaxID=3158972 RepID=UPI0027BAD8D4|nr:sensor histidine kinase [Streptomyces coralus]WLW50579.1 sensor histidine kinase [Streptomyces coralus]
MTEDQRPRAADAALAAALFACSLPGSLITLPGDDPQIAWWPGVLLTGVACAALLWRRDRPRGTAAVTIACAIAVSALGYVLTALLLGPLMVALYWLAVRTDRRTANTFAFSTIALLVGTGLITGPDDEPLVLKVLGPTAWLLLPTALGTVVRLRGDYLEAVRARAEHAERTREEEARRRVTEERMRIARDLHDVVAHHLLLANLQAGAVARMLPARPEEAGRIVADLSGTTSSALRELKSTVGLLRHHADNTATPPGGEAVPGSDRPPTPTPGLAELPELAASFRHAGLTVTLVVEGEPGPVAAGVALTAYRIAQEALTNVTKHAGSRSAEVRLVHTSDGLVLTITDDAPPRPAGPSAPSGGYGLIGMRERVRSVGGRIRMGHRPEGGFEVVAELPVRP